eukprot:10973485-Karenia_brevis.AAC.1
MELEVLSAGKTTMYLGRLLAFEDFHDIELQHRMKRAWAKFYSLKTELCNRAFSLSSRLRLFQST